MLQAVITRASRAIARQRNRVPGVQTYQDQFWPLRDPFPWQLPSTFFPLSQLPARGRGSAHRAALDSLHFHADCFRRRRYRPPGATKARCSPPLRQT
jgi:hypothetical protein